MRIEISLPDELFRRAEAVARRLGLSRSELYTNAISRFLDSHSATGVTERLNEIYGRQPAKIHPGLNRAQLKTIEIYDY